MKSEQRASARHSLRLRMGFLAFLSFNLSMSTMWGSFGVLMAPIETRLGVGRDLSSLAAAIVMIVVALLAPVGGALLSRISLRWLMMIGSLMGAAGFALLSVTTNIYVLLLAYGLLVGPSMSLCGLILPPALVTRWFTSGRGRALGFVHIPIALVLLPLICAFVLRGYGLSTVYLVLSGLMILNLIAQSFVREYPPPTEVAADETTLVTPTDAGASAGELMRQKTFWVMTIANASNVAATMMLTSHVVSMAIGWGIDTTKAASLMTVMSFAGLAGPLLFGWLADKFGGRAMQIVLCVDSAVLWSVLAMQTQPSFPILAIIIALFGLHSSGGVPIFAVALSERFGQGSFGRAYGLGNMAGLPFTVLSVPLAASIYVKTGSYQQALLIQVVFFVVAALLLSVIGGRRALSRENEGLGSKATVV